MVAWVYALAALAGASTGAFVLLMLFQLRWGHLFTYAGASVVGFLALGYWVALAFTRGH